MFQTPITVMLKLTVPVVDYEAPLNNWNKDLHVLHCVTGPVVAVFLADYSGKPLTYSPQLLYKIFLKNNFEDMSPFLGPLIPLFQTSGEVFSGFQSQSGQSYLHLAEAYVIYIP